MKTSVRVVTLSCLMGIALCSPVDGDSNSKNIVRTEQPSVKTITQLSEIDLDSIINQLFTDKPPQDQLPNNEGGETERTREEERVSESVNSQPKPQTGPGDGDCTCVPYYLCNQNNTIIEDGTTLIDARIKLEACNNYLETCCRTLNTQPTDQPIRAKHPANRESSCGNRNLGGIDFRLTGNTDSETQYGEFPWMMAVLRRQTKIIPNETNKSVIMYQCGGSLIHPKVVLTGAHCVNKKDNLLVRAGEWDTQTKHEPYQTQDRRVSEVIIHEQFNIGSLANDTALLILESPVDMSLPNVGLICLPEPNENMDGRNCIATGWGKDVFGKEGRYSSILKRVDLPVVPRETCLNALRKTRLGNHFKLDKSFLCAGGQPGKDTCKGDGGGPLVCPSLNNDNVYFQAGIVAWGISCSTETPGVYVSVPLFVNWINEQLRVRNIL